MMFGESSDHPDHNGDDMMWNLTSTEIEETGSWQNGGFEQDVILGGRHYVYVMKTQYAGSDAESHSEYDHLTGMSSNSNKEITREAVWVLYRCYPLQVQKFQTEMLRLKKSVSLKHSM